MEKERNDILMYNKYFVKIIIAEITEPLPGDLFVSELMKIKTHCNIVSRQIILKTWP